MRRKKTPAPPTEPIDLQIRHLADGTEILPIINGKEMFPELIKYAIRFDNILRLLGKVEPDTFDEKDPAGTILQVAHLARHFCDLHSLDFQIIDRDAHAVYAEKRWSAHEAHHGTKG